jgi:hypothetical protein
VVVVLGLLVALADLAILHQEQAEQVRLHLFQVHQ